MLFSDQYLLAEGEIDVLLIQRLERNWAKYARVTEKKQKTLDENRNR